MYLQFMAVFIPQDVHGQTALHVSCRNGHGQVGDMHNTMDSHIHVFLFQHPGIMMKCEHALISGVEMYLYMQ